MDPDQGLPFNLLGRQRRPGTKHPFGHQDPWRVCKVGRVLIMRPAVVVFFSGLTDGFVL